MAIISALFKRFINILINFPLQLIDSTFYFSTFSPTFFDSLEASCSFHNTPLSTILFKDSIGVYTFDLIIHVILLLGCGDGCALEETKVVLLCLIILLWHGMNRSSFSSSDKIASVSLPILLSAFGFQWAPAREANMSYEGSGNGRPYSNSGEVGELAAILRTRLAGSIVYWLDGKDARWKGSHGGHRPTYG